jgi:ketosteroid isomerase-like protein
LLVFIEAELPTRNWMTTPIFKSDICVVKQCYRAWEAREIERILAVAADDCRYHIHVPQDLLHFAGLHAGKEAVRRCLQMIQQELEFLAFAVDWIRDGGDSIRARIVYYYRHPGSGEQMEGCLRHVWRLARGNVVSLDEFHDVPRLRAFLELPRR